MPVRYRRRETPRFSVMVCDEFRGRGSRIRKFPLQYFSDPRMEFFALTSEERLISSVTDECMFEQIRGIRTRAIRVKQLSFGQDTKGAL